MTGIKIDGIQISTKIKLQVKKKIKELKSRGIQPCLATILVGNNLASLTYIKNKHTACKEVGIKTIDHKLPQDVSQNDINNLIEALNKNDKVHGILVQLPLSNTLSKLETISRISPKKDVDGLTPHNLGMLTFGKKTLVACTPSGILEIFDHYNISIQGKNVVVINRTELIGKPLYNLLLSRNATVILCHSFTTDLKKLCKIGDIIITAVGNRQKFILTDYMIKKNAIIIDVAISRQDGKLMGDVDFNKIIKKASYVTPVPGGVGPITVAMLLKNTTIAALL
ncbi:MAG: bifunctional 5,10-methylenetetrahydrofolate dehydrogenase/5,10-methenyltetrahydrofolate cyclohydrolase [Thaumarchaeota archaeon]|nr:bifunctional 5,10-methylenetetrahydrofolate dehydrogenase/5,10-methenyltetrahydrofolate cyclohydrolase [Nitrososphaerota archaeon]MCY3975713.1 bifunctional 5,10-methylenetetrahydrofolate dehydrogenase/5,10-methenyltetrahydrofolate cyclohydrolase [Nitrososphaerota archaeon]